MLSITKRLHCVTKTSYLKYLNDTPSKLIIAPNCVLKIALNLLLFGTSQSWGAIIVHYPKTRKFIFNWCPWHCTWSIIIMLEKSSATLAVLWGYFVQHVIKIFSSCGAKCNEVQPIVIKSCQSEPKPWTSRWSSVVIQIHYLGTMNVVPNFVPMHPVDVEICHWITKNVNPPFRYHAKSCNSNSSCDVTPPGEWPLGRQKIPNIGSKWYILFGQNAW